ncbi:hypothetical protein [Mammaliicoccus sciuri]|uniref:hypothetical protein n=1 Tax=Mammaliicoccus sciuri TaxID=1296 RepID=UPI001FB3A476|nr:hypothetical protein [Mammaliicoccus sciuri]MCJ1776318.1 hypothetical protein [Mammaliicoccus sciuri]
MNIKQLRDMKLSAEQVKLVMAMYGQSVKQYENTINYNYKVNEENEKLYMRNGKVKEEADKLSVNIKLI